MPYDVKRPMECCLYRGFVESPESGDEICNDESAFPNLRSAIVRKPQIPKPHDAQIGENRG